MKQHITQEQAVELASLHTRYDMVEHSLHGLHAFAEAAIQHYLSEQAKELPWLPDHITDVLVITGPSTHKHMQAGQYYYTADQLQAYGQQCAAHAREVALEEAAEVCDDFDVCDPERIAYAIRLKKVGK